MTVVRTRFAPSPTGMLHLGSVRTALYCYLWAKKNGGEYLLRIEDTDLARSTEASVNQIFEGFQWLGLDKWVEPVVYQSKRNALYESELQKLWAANKIYPAFETEDENAEARAKAEAAKRTYVYDGASAHLPRAEAQAKMDAGQRFLWRLRVNKNEQVTVQETLMSDNGTVTISNTELGDFPLTRMGTVAQPGMPLYNFCNVVDDNDQKVTHIIRGVEHLGNAARQVLIYNAFGYAVPTFTHLPLIMRNGKKMSKRDPVDPRQSVSITDRRDHGYLPEAILNHIALCGWSLGETQEFATLDEMVQAFDIKDLVKSNANFDEDKLLHFNAHYIREMAKNNAPRLVALVKEFLNKAGIQYAGFEEAKFMRLVQIAAERARLLADFPELIGCFFQTPTSYDEAAAAKNFNPQTAGAFRDLNAPLSSADFTHDALEAAVKSYAEAKGMKPKDLMPALRLALTGRASSPGSVFDTMELLGRVTTQARLDAAAAFIERKAA